jgi:hypothetical protein
LRNSQTNEISTGNFTCLHSYDHFNIYLDEQNEEEIAAMFANLEFKDREMLAKHKK